MFKLNRCGIVKGEHQQRTLSSGIDGVNALYTNTENVSACLKQLACDGTLSIHH